MVWPDTITWYYLQLTDTMGNISYDSVTITVVKCSGTGFEGSDPKNRKVKLYPNPTTGLLNIAYDFNQSAQYRIELFDLLGRKLLSQSIQTDKANININSLSKGTYIIKLYENSNVIFTEKVMKF